MNEQHDLTPEVIGVMLAGDDLKPEQRQTLELALAQLTGANVVEMPSKEEADEKQRIKVAAHLIGYALADYDLTLDQDGQPCAVAKEGVTNIALSLDALRYPMSARYFDDFGKPAGRSAWPEAEATLFGLAMREGRRRIFTRVGSARGWLFLDLGREDGQCVAIGPKGWSVINPGDTPVLFRRPGAVVRELPLPIGPGSLRELGYLLRRSEREWDLIVAWMVTALRAEAPCPVLVLLGEQGAGKSVTAKAIISLVDPGAPLGRIPSGEEKLQNAAFGQRVYGIDNISHIQPWLSDALCAIVTGEHDKRRKLYTDATPFHLTIKSAVVLTGISITGAGPDLMERMLPVHLSTIPSTERRDEEAMLAELAEKMPSFLAGLLDATSKVLALVAAKQRPPTLPRMADFGMTLYALDGAGITNGSFDHYTKLAPITSAYEVMSGTDFGADLEVWLEGMLPAVGNSWQGTTQDALDSISRQRFGDGMGNVRIPSSVGYPHTPRGLTAALRRLAPALRILGVEWVPADVKKNSRDRLMTLRRVAESPEVK